MIHKDSTLFGRDAIKRHDVPECTPSCVDLDFRIIWLLVEASP